MNVHKLTKQVITILKDPLDVEPVGGARFVVGTTSKVGSQLACSGFVHHPWICLVNSICLNFINNKKEDREKKRINKRMI
jgi:hypothetical protein